MIRNDGWITSQLLSYKALADFLHFYGSRMTGEGESGSGEVHLESFPTTIRKMYVVVIS